jgi:dTDP-4-amino-4,6-dideoxygalactose transaminase
MSTKRSIKDIALFGAAPLFELPRHVGQLNLPEWDRFEAAMQGIFDRQFYTNHGPKVRELEERLASHLGVRHAICMTNGTTALMVAARALDLEGQVILPAFTFIATAQALIWAGLEPVFCDVDPVTHTISAEKASPLITQNTSAILGVHLWGRPCDIQGLESLAQDKGLRLFYDAAHAVGCSHKGRMIGNFGEVEVFSMHATKVLNAAEGGFATTNDDLIADKLRTIRNFHTTETFVETPLRINAKMSEAQAAMGLLSLDDLTSNSLRNKDLYKAYGRCLAGLPGISLVSYDENETNNYQYLIVDVDPEHAALSRDELVLLLEKENVLARRYFTPGAHKAPPFCDDFPQYVDTLPVTDSLSSRLMQLPLGENTTEQDVETICGLIRTILNHGSEIRQRLHSMG